MTIYRALQIRPCHRGDWTSHRFEMRTPPSPWHRIDEAMPDATHLLDCLKEAILTNPELIGENLTFSNGIMVAEKPGEALSRSGQEMTQMELFEWT